MRVENLTPFVAERMVMFDKEGAEQLVVLAKATFAIKERGRLSVAEHQRPIQLVDEFYGEPGVSSIRVPSDFHPPKPGTDVLLLGHAIAPESGARKMDVRIRVGSLEHSVRVFGVRRWRRFLWWQWASKPRPFAKVALRWENAYGGTDQTPKNSKRHAWDPRNPVGRGFRAKGSRKKEFLPNLEDPRGMLRRPHAAVAPAGFGPLARHWMPRSKYGGTYDDKWLKDRIPLLPEDFDDRFHHCAPPALIAKKKLRGDEKLELEGCTPEGALSFRLPGLHWRARVKLGRRSEEVPMALDLVMVDADARELVLVSSGMLRVHGLVPAIKEIAFSCESERRE